MMCGHDPAYCKHIENTSALCNGASNLLDATPCFCLTSERGPRVNELRACPLHFLPHRSQLLHRGLIPAKAHTHLQVRAKQQFCGLAAERIVIYQSLAESARSDLRSASLSVLSDVRRRASLRRRATCFSSWPCRTSSVASSSLRPACTVDLEGLRTMQQGSE